VAYQLRSNASRACASASSAGAAQYESGWVEPNVPSFEFSVVIWDTEMRGATGGSSHAV
jgi:hypothetical protein